MLSLKVVRYPHFSYIIMKLFEITNSWGNYFHQVSWGEDKKVDFLINGQFLNVSHFFTQTLYGYLKRGITVPGC